MALGLLLPESRILRLVIEIIVEVVSVMMLINLRPLMPLSKVLMLHGPSRIPT